MTLRTQRNDWFTSALAALPRAFVSGSPVTSKRFNIAGTVTLRLMGHWPPDHVLVLVDGLPTYYHLMLGLIAVEVETWTDEEQFEISPLLETLRDRLASLIKAPVDIIVFCQQQQEDGGLYPFKLLRTGKTQVTFMTDVEYAAVIHELRGEDTHPNPSIKQQNRSTNDNLVFWSGQQLPAKPSFNDIDAMITLAGDQSPSRIILELKRPSKVRLAAWRPYPNDVSNYRLMQSVVHANNNVLDITLAYRADQVGHLSLFTLEQCGRTRLAGTRREIRGTSATEAVRLLVLELEAIRGHSGQGVPWTRP